jgi:hypothetical protein
MKKGWYWWGGRPGRLSLAGTEARPTKLFLCKVAVKTLNIHVILNGAPRSEESRRLKKRDSSLRSGISPRLTLGRALLFGKMVRKEKGKATNAIFPVFRLE